MTDFIEIEIRDDPVTGKKRKLEHRQLRILKNLEMIHDVEIVFYENVEGNYGEKTLTAINTLPITEDQRKRQRETFKNIIISVGTHGTIVNAETGEPVSPEIEGAIKDLYFWQNIPISTLGLDGTANLEDVVYSAMRMSMEIMNARERL
ncbi:hypothetical protein JMN32_19885 [Fulvivirga sp. 29W222]|uniref:Uncharacterized protein n=1 Tax=Fulvivirga marina TaxID=2494733 RepID=A0A937G0W1_9BACT|nr:hypothetical protein [Fulvivirga marina]MBL6448582.1 hypothetical protein [Fulvivirga marina]